MLSSPNIWTCRWRGSTTARCYTRAYPQAGLIGVDVRACVRMCVTVRALMLMNILMYKRLAQCAPLSTTALLFRQKQTPCYPGWCQELVGSVCEGLEALPFEAWVRCPKYTKRTRTHACMHACSRTSIAVKTTRAFMIKKVFAIEFQVFALPLQILPYSFTFLPFSAAFSYRTLHSLFLLTAPRGGFNTRR